jgi:superfamily I DNA/RNA helicase
MGERVKRLLPDQAIEGIMLGTFHSICARILRREQTTCPSNRIS